MRSLDDLLKNVGVIVERDLENRPSLPASVAIGEAQKHVVDYLADEGAGLDADELTTMAALVVSAIVRFGEATGLRTRVQHVLSGVPLANRPLPDAAANDKELFLNILRDLADALIAGGQATSDAQLEVVIDRLMNPVRAFLSRAQTAP